jgi:hypothetical protein
MEWFIMNKNEQYEIESILFDIYYHGYITIKLEKLYRILGKGNRAAGTWKALLDVWEGIDGDRTDLYATELIDGMLILTNKPVDQLTTWAGE